MNWTEASSLATGAGTLVLAIATFGSVRSANRAARIAEQSLRAGLRPVLIPTREDDAHGHVTFGDGHRVDVPGHSAVIDAENGVVYLVVGVRNAGAGVAVIHGWRAHAFDPDTPAASAERPDPDDFRRQQIDLYIPVGEAGVWLGAMRDPAEPRHRKLEAAAISGARVLIDLLYGDIEGGQRAIVRFSAQQSEDGSGYNVTILRHWNVDGVDPR